MHFVFVAFRSKLLGTAGSAPFGESNRVVTSLSLTPWREVFWRIGTTKEADVGKHFKGVQRRRLTLQLATGRTGIPFI
jgi:hypothetical protein